MDLRGGIVSLEYVTSKVQHTALDLPLVQISIPSPSWTGHNGFEVGPVNGMGAGGGEGGEGGL